MPTTVGSKRRSSASSPGITRFCCTFWLFSVALIAAMVAGFAVKGPPEDDGRLWAMLMGGACEPLLGIEKTFEPRAVSVIVLEPPGPYLATTGVWKLRTVAGKNWSCPVVPLRRPGPTIWLDIV